MAENWKIPVSPVSLAATAGSLSGRLVAYFIDILVIAAITLVFYFVIGFLGLITFGLAWMVFAVPGTLIAILYSTFTVSSPSQGTFGMRAMGIRLLDARTGGTVPLLHAAVHALLFYVAVMSTFLVLLDIAIGLFRPDSRLGRDLIASVVAVRS